MIKRGATPPRTNPVMPSTSARTVLGVPRFRPFGWRCYPRLPGVSAPTFRSGNDLSIGYGAFERHYMSGSGTWCVAPAVRLGLWPQPLDWGRYPGATGGVAAGPDINREKERSKPVIERTAKNAFKSRVHARERITVSTISYDGENKRPRSTQLAVGRKYKQFHRAYACSWRENVLS